MTRVRGASTAELTVPLDALPLLCPSLGPGPEARRWARRLGIDAARSIRSFGGRHAGATGPIDVVDLFCGCGGLSLGFEQVGRMTPSYRLAAAVDWDRHSVETYASNLPIQPVLADLELITSSKKRLDAFVASLPLRPEAPLVVVGGPPCQGFSAHRKKNSVGHDSRNGLVSAFARIVTRLRPDFLVLENVPEILAQRHWGYFEQLKRALAQSGYLVRTQIHNLGGFGVPQERFRAIVMASTHTFSMPKPFLDKGKFRTVRQAIGRLPAVAPGERSLDRMHYCTNHRPSTIAVIRRIPKDGGRRQPGVGPSCLDRVDGFRDVYGRLYWDRPANTITAYSRNPASGRYVHPEQDRGLTIREAALLQGFPRTFEFEGPFDHTFLQIGNAVPPPFSAYLAAHILGELVSPGDDDVVDELGEDIHRPESNSFSSGIAGRKKGRRT